MNLLDKLFNKRVIVNCDHQPYLTRWFLFRKEWMAIFLHRFHRSDEDRALHDHPWNFITLILWRGYHEHMDYKMKAAECHWLRICKRRWPLMILYRPAYHRHRVELINGKEAWTLVIRFRKIREWGFWPNGEFVHWVTWWQNNCE